MSLLKNKKELYQLKDEKKLQEFRQLDENEGDKAIDCYNTCIDLLSDFVNGIINTNRKTNAYHAKYRELLEKLDIIGRNNIRALYVGISEKNEKIMQNSNKKTNSKSLSTSKVSRPKLIGRLATTIIMEDGLWIG